MKAKTKKYTTAKTLPLGGITLIDKVEKDFGLISEVFSCISNKAEKFIRALKEGNELRPVRHWSKYAILGAIFTCFLATSIYNLTVKILKNSPVKNLKLLKNQKFLQNLTC